MTASRGRSKFARWRWLLAAMTALFRLLPRRASRFVYGCVMGWPGLLGVATRYALAARLARGIGESVMIGTEVEILGWERLEIGSHVSINRGCYLDATGGLRIGDNVSIAHACSIMTTEHTWENEMLPIRENPLRPDPVRIEDDVWLGCGVRLLAGATVHSRAVIAAGAVVTKDVPARTIVGGVPARPIKVI